ncbi:MAG: tRNA-dihydrouridine synthase [Candidatus Hydrogenedentota bacterium]|nr:MAG: tRNA-dihydrouridine synthase [Candidatus Hydrogenedentota bacterium]
MPLVIPSPTQDFAGYLREVPLVVAPMADVTDTPFRRILRRFFPGLLFTEMISAEGILHGSEKTFRMVETVPEEEAPVGIQILGADPTRVAEAARLLIRYRPAVLDINMGCPVRKVLKNGSGAALLSDPKRAGEVVRAVRDTVDLPVTVKIRLGLDHDNAEDVIAALFCAGAVAVTVHGRTAVQLYRGPADRRRVLEIARAAPLPIVVSGDVRTEEDVREILSGGAAGALLARGILGRPWFAARALAAARGSAPPPRPSCTEVIEDHLDEVLRWSGEEGIRAFRRHLVEYVRFHPRARRLRHALVTAQSSREIRRILRDLSSSFEEE